MNDALWSFILQKIAGLFFFCSQYRKGVRISENLIIAGLAIIQHKHINKNWWDSAYSLLSMF